MPLPSATPAGLDEPGPGPGEPLALDDGRPRRLDPRLVPCERLGGGLFVGGLFLAAVVTVVWLALGGELVRARLVLLAGLMLVAITALAVVGWIHPALKLRTSSWRLDAEGFEIHSGVWFQHVRTVPRARVQHTDVERGPIERRYGLASLVVHTAGHQDSEIRLGGLAHETAVAIRDHLLADGNERGRPAS
jgi:hypothetical protein